MFKNIKLIPDAYAAPKEVSIGPNFVFGQYANLGELISQILRPLFFIAGTIVLIYFIVGAFRMVISNGDKNIIASAREEMVHGIIGFILLIVLVLFAEYVPKLFELQGFKIIGF